DFPHRSNIGRRRRQGAPAHREQAPQSSKGAGAEATAAAPATAFTAGIVSASPGISGDRSGTTRGSRQSLRGELAHGTPDRRHRAANVTTLGVEDGSPLGIS